MNYLDIYYRALIDYRRSTGDFRECMNQRDAVAKANAQGDSITVIKKVCTVDKDWVEAIEEGLVHVEKAIREERQFIRSNGEVIDIEKVKNVSKDSAEHLARHSNLITRYEEGQDVVPDRLYTVERLSDFAVYENRFLYMLLCYLRDFITLRYNKILELEHTYNGSLEMNKTVVMTKRSISFEIKMQEERKDDIYLKKQSESRDIIVRIGNQLKLVLAFLATPLMQEVSKASMLKPPITKTNVLRMNHNFRGALALYEFISAYDKPGYTVEERVNEQSPFRLDVADEVAELVMLASFLTYEHGLSLKDELQKEYDLEEARRLEEEKDKLLDQLRAMRHRIRESGGNAEEYMLMLEKTNRLLQGDREALALSKAEIAELNSSVDDLLREKEQLNEEITRLKQEMEKMTLDHSAELENINKENEADKRHIISEWSSRVDELNGIMSAKEQEREAEREKTRVENSQIVDSIRAMWQAEVEGLKGQISALNGEVDALKGEAEELIEKHRISEARLTALRSQHGLIGDTEDFTSEAIFTEMERQLDAFVKFFKKQWGITKKAIKKRAKEEYRASLKAQSHKDDPTDNENAQE